jgi:hypothetical protein
MDHVEIGWRGVDWIGVAQDRYGLRALANVVMKFQFPSREVPNGCRAVVLPSCAQFQSYTES